ncbi:MAG: hypothetical protein JWR17_80 [Pseudomonas sp.]|jgi:hypothetical protein|uniref:hypothetical protein n=1 Tax=Pseudomonas sp. TaxID=306 RepID=UPI00262380DC|nr:hypothetical protein [Pseudomonas sp.]MDB6047334.1 hypothetical protein [Pseudomonas sp.]
MRITGTNPFPVNSTPYRKLPTATSPVESVSAKTPKQAVVISGEALMKQRLFPGSDPNTKLLTPVKGASSQPVASFLTPSDKSLLAQMYTFTQDQGADLRYADALGLQLADYRESGHVIKKENPGPSLDSNGRKISYSFTTKDAAIAKRVLSGEAIKTTQLDQGFIRFKMDKKYGATNHSDFEFMEKIVNKFSAKGGATSLGSTFSTYADKDKNYIRHASKERYEITAKGAELVGKGSKKGKGKSGTALDPKSATPATLKDILRQIIFRAMGSGGRNSLPSLADYLMRNRQ